MFISMLRCYCQNESTFLVIFKRFFIVFDHVNACASMPSLVEIHNILQHWNNCTDHLHFSLVYLLGITRPLIYMVTDREPSINVKNNIFGACKTAQSITKKSMSQVHGYFHFSQSGCKLVSFTEFGKLNRRRGQS